MDEERRLRQEALLKEYEMCQQEATSTANWIWAASSIFLAVWITALAVVAANIAKVTGTSMWLLAALAVAAQWLWVIYLARSLEVRQIMLLCQRQIEERLDMLKSTGAFAAGHIGDCKYLNKLRDHLTTAGKSEFDDFLKRYGDEIRSPVVIHLERKTPWLAKIVDLAIALLRLEWLWGRAGRNPLYALSFLVGVSWITLVILRQIDRL